MVRYSALVIPPADVLSVIYLQLLIVTLVFGSQGVYQSRMDKTPLSRLMELSRAWLMSFAFLMLIGVVTKTNDHYSRWWFFAWTVFSLVGLLSARVLERRLLEAGTWLDSLCRQHGAQELWLLPDSDNLASMERMNEQIVTLDVDIRMFFGLWNGRFSDYPKTDLYGLPVIDISVNPHTGGNRIIKSLCDKTGSLVLLVLLSPILLAIAALIRLTSPGPVIFSQYRQGLNGTVFKLYKFRSMHVHEEQVGHLTQAVRDDARVTWLGRFLRRWNLDELPQLYNVLRGDMSLVGPRPHALPHNQYYQDRVQDYMQRHKVKPGITGWAQVNGWRGETDTIDKMKMRVDHDIFYIRNWSLALDLKILLLTILKLFFDRNAY